MGLQSSSFGQMTVNIAAGIGMKQAMKTVNYETETLDQQCKLQQEFARELGGYVNKGTSEDPNYQISFGSHGEVSSGILGEELQTQIDSADDAGDAIKNEAMGTLSAAIVGTVAVIGSGLAMKFAGGSKETEDEIGNLKGFKNELGNPAGDDADVELGSVHSDDSVDDDAINARIAKWKGSDIKEADFSDYVKDGEGDEAILNRKAMERLNDGHHQSDLAAVNRNIDRGISKAEMRYTDSRMQARNTLTQVISQASGAGEGYSKAGGQIAQASNTQDSQKDTAYAAVLEKAINNINQQASTAAQAASQRQQEITNTLQNIATPA